MVIYIILLILLILLISLIIMIGYSYKLCKIVVYPKKKSYEMGYESIIKKLDLQDFINNLKKEEVTLKSDYGYSLKGLFIPNKSSKKCIILCHGITANINYSAKYIKPFYDRGFSVFLYDHRNHGVSGGEDTSMGYFEKYDLKKCADFIFDKLGSDTILGVLGESMGAGTVMQYCAIDNRPSFCIEDCGYSDVSELFRVRLKEDYKINFPPLLFLTSIIMKIKYGWTFKSASPIRYIKDLSLPMLFIHGGKDSYVPTYMVYDLYNAKIHGIKDIYIADEAVHADSFMYNPSKYDEVIGKFLNKINLG